MKHAMLPVSLNFPGWLASDTFYTINQFNKFRLSGKDSFIKFAVTQESIFKVFIPNKMNSLQNQLHLYKLKKKSTVKKKIAESVNSGGNHLNVILQKGDYVLDLAELASENNAELNEKGECEVFEMFTGIMPMKNVEGNSIQFNGYCDNYKLLDIEPNSLHTSKKVLVSKEQDVHKDGFLRLKPAGESVFIAEFIFNSYLDTNYEINVYEDNNPGEVTNIEKLSLTTIQTVYHENMIWVEFKTIKDTSYILKLTPKPYVNLIKTCDTIIWSCSYTEESTIDKNIETGKADADERSNIKVEEEKKEVCKVNDFLPDNLYKGKKEALLKFGGAQRKNGSISFLGKFLLPLETRKIRTSFKIKNSSFVVLNVRPKHKNISNIDVSIYLDKKMIFSYYKPSYGHKEEYPGASFFKLKKNKSPYYVEIIFETVKDKNEVNNCETYEFAVAIVPEKIFNERNISCNITEKKELPSSLVIKGPVEMTFEFFFNMDNMLNKIVKNQKGDYEFLIRIENKKSISLVVNISLLILL